MFGRKRAKKHLASSVAVRDGKLQPGWELLRTWHVIYLLGMSIAMGAAIGFCAGLIVHISISVVWP